MRLASYEQNSTATYGVRLMSRPFRDVIINLDSNYFTNDANAHNLLVIHGKPCEQSNKNPTAAPTASPTSSLLAGNRGVISSANYSGPCYNESTETWQLVFGTDELSWKTEKQVSISLYRDDYIDEDHMTITLKHRLSTRENYYKRLPSSFTHLTVFDDDKVDIMITPTNLVVTEGSAEQVVYVRLRTHPSGTVHVDFESRKATSTGDRQTRMCVVDATSDSDCDYSTAVAQTTVYFTASNWHTQQGSKSGQTMTATWEATTIKFVLMSRVLVMPAIMVFMLLRYT